MPAPAATQQAIQRALEAAKACGLRIIGFSVSRDGTVQVTTTESVDMAGDAGKVVKPKAWSKR